VLLNDGSGAFPDYTEYAVPGDPVEIAPLDFDLDGDIDLVVSMYGSATGVWMLSNTGEGQFGVQMQLIDQCGGAAIVPADLDGDGAEIGLKDGVHISRCDPLVPLLARQMYLPVPS